MIRGTDAQFKFVIPYDYSHLSKVTVVFWQDGNDGLDRAPLPIYKSREQCIPTSNPRELIVTLNEDETLRFSETRKAYVQLSAETIEGTSFASKKEMITVYPIFDDSDVDDTTPSPGEDDDNDGWIVLDGRPIQEWW